jgi:hypothetical protein
MMRGVVVLTLVAVVLAGNAFGQDDDLRAGAMRQISQFCIAAPEMAGEVNVEAKCQCAAQVIVETWSERELTLFTRVFAHYPDQDAARAELERMMAVEGYTEGDFAAVSDRFRQSSETVSAKCDA